MIWNAVTPKFLIVQAIVACVFVAAWWQGWPQYMVAADKTYLTAAIAALAVCGIIAEGLGRYSIADYLTDRLPTYGLFGTVVGIAIVAANSGGDFHSILGGMATSFFTTMAGLLGSEWMRLTRALK